MNIYLTHNELMDLRKQIDVSGWDSVTNDRFAELVTPLVEGIVRKFQNVVRTEQEDLIQDGLLVVYKNFTKFDPNRSDNYFSYLTTVIYNDFKRIYRKNLRYAEMLVLDDVISKTMDSENTSCKRADNSDWD